MDTLVSIFFLRRLLHRHDPVVPWRIAGANIGTAPIAGFVSAGRSILLLFFFGTPKEETRIGKARVDGHHDDIDRATEGNRLRAKPEATQPSGRPWRAWRALLRWFYERAN